jgi:hypothetical protein
MHPGEAGKRITGGGLMACVLLVALSPWSLAAEDEPVIDLPFDIMQVLKAVPDPKDLEEAAAIVDQGFMALMQEQDLAVQSVRVGLGNDDGGEPMAIGDGGTLWCFWAIDAPQAHYLAGMVGRLSQDLPEVRIRAVHILPLTNWVSFMREANQIKQAILTAGYHNRPNEAKQIAYDFMHRYASLRDMPQLYGTNTIRVFANVEAAIFFRIGELPAFVYISPNGIVHKLTGAGAGISLAEWIGLCLSWERAQAQADGDEDQRGEEER